MAVGKAYDGAVRLAKENPHLDIGIHLCLTEEKPILTKGEVSSLIGEDSSFLKTSLGFILNYLLGRVRSIEIQRELDAQIRKGLNSDLRITHIDSHGYIHMLPSILKIVMRLAKKYGIPFIRYPYERLMVLSSNFSRYLFQFGLNSLCLFLRGNFIHESLLKAEYFCGFLQSGHLSEKYLTKILKTIDNGVTELVCHPGIYDEETKRYKHWRYKWEEELKALTSPDIKKIIRDLDIELVSFREIL